MIYVIANYSDVYPLLTFACARQRAELKPIIVLSDESSTVSRPIIGIFAAVICSDAQRLKHRRVEIVRQRDIGVPAIHCRTGIAPFDPVNAHGRVDTAVEDHRRGKADWIAHRAVAITQQPRWIGNKACLVQISVFAVFR
jgi:hypothetical protein